MNYIGGEIGGREVDMYARTHTHTQFQNKIQAIKWPSKQINKKLLT